MSGVGGTGYGVGDGVQPRRLEDMPKGDSWRVNLRGVRSGGEYDQMYTILKVLIKIVCFNLFSREGLPM